MRIPRNPAVVFLFGLSLFGRRFPLRPPLSAIQPLDFPKLVSGLFHRPAKRLLLNLVFHADRRLFLFEAHFGPNPVQLIKRIFHPDPAVIAAHTLYADLGAVRIMGRIPIRHLLFLFHVPAPAAAVNHPLRGALDRENADQDQQYDQNSIYQLKRLPFHLKPNG